MPMTRHEQTLSPRLAALVAALEARGHALDAPEAGRLLRSAEIDYRDVAAFVEESPESYVRRRVARTESFELLVMTWRPGQRSAPHDHAGSLCALRVVSGRAREARYARSADGLVDRACERDLPSGAVLVDGAAGIHAIENAKAAPEVLVTLHVYAPPLPELRRYAVRPCNAEPSPAFLRPRARGAPCVAVVGAGFSGTLVAAHLLKRGAGSRRPLHVVLVDRQPAAGEGAAYRTAEPRHLLNVPAASMSAWPDLPASFFDWARSRDARVQPADFLPRTWYGEYLRAMFFDAARAAGGATSIELVGGEVQAMRRLAGGGYRIASAERGDFEAAVVVLATGHRPPDDPLEGRWTGPRARFIPDPWASLALGAIGPDEPVVLIGSGLSAIDALLTLTNRPRVAPVIAISRRGLLPATHARAPGAPRDLSAWVERVMAQPLTAYGLLRAFREEVSQAEVEGVDFRAVVDGLRTHTPRLWRALPRQEAARLLRHVRPFWEVRRHRMAPHLAAVVDELAKARTFRVIAGRILSARADDDGVALAVRRRGCDGAETIRASWVVNCTGPGELRLSRSPLFASLAEAGLVRADPLRLGVVTGPRGEAVGASGPLPDLFVVGTMRKPDLWESTAVPELRVQAAHTAAAVLEHLEASSWNSW